MFLQKRGNFLSIKWKFSWRNLKFFSKKREFFSKKRDFFSKKRNKKIGIFFQKKGKNFQIDFLEMFVKNRFAPENGNVCQQSICARKRKCFSKIDFSRKWKFLSKIEKVFVNKYYNCIVITKFFSKKKKFLFSKNGEKRENFAINQKFSSTIKSYRMISWWNICNGLSWYKDITCKMVKL